MSKIICGKNSVIDAIKNNYKIINIYTTRELNFNTKNIEVIYTDNKFLDSLTTNNHQGIVAIVENNFQYYSIKKIIEEKPNIILVLDHIEDPHNFGAILRSANAAGVNHIVIPDKRSIDVNDTVMKVSSGGFINMKISKVSSLQATIDLLKENNYWVYATTLNESAQDYSKVDYNSPTVLIVGNEAKGVSRTLIKASDQTIYIPMKGTVQSLNVSVATGILLFEVVKKLL